MSQKWKKKWGLLYRYIENIYLHICLWLLWSMVYIYLCIQYLSPLKLWIYSHLWHGMLITTCIKFVGDMQQVDGFLWTLLHLFPLPMQTDAMIQWMKYCWKEYETTIIHMVHLHGQIKFSSNFTWAPVCEQKFDRLNMQTKTFDGSCKYWKGVWLVPIWSSKYMTLLIHNGNKKQIQM